MTINIRELENQRDALNSQIKSYYKEKEDSIIEKRKQYIGKCYKRVLENSNIMYIKIISIYNEFRVNTIRFISPFILNDIDLNEFDGVFVFDDYGLFCHSRVWDYIGNWTEITSEEFSEKMDEVYCELKKTTDMLQVK